MEGSRQSDWPRSRRSSQIGRLAILCYYDHGRTGPGFGHGQNLDAVAVAGGEVKPCCSREGEQAGSACSAGAP